MCSHLPLEHPLLTHLPNRVRENGKGKTRLSYYHHVSIRNDEKGGRHLTQDGGMSENGTKVKLHD